MRVPIVVERVHKVFDVQAALDIAFDAQAPLKEKRVRILATPDQRKEIAQAAANADGGRARADGAEAGRANLKIQPRVGLSEVEAERTTFNFGEARGDTLSAQRVICQRGKGRTQQGMGECAQQRAAGGQQGTFDHDRAACRIGALRALIYINSRLMRLPVRSRREVTS